MSATVVPFSPFPNDPYDLLAMRCGIYPSYAGIIRIEDFPYTKVEINDEFIEEEDVYPGDEREKDILMKMYF